jgi:predicted enzyme related to lactoylglutathione lyase
MSGPGWRRLPAQQQTGDYRSQHPAKGETTMGLTVQHVHLKTRDVAKTIDYYVQNFGATMKAEIAGRGWQLDLHGVQLNITGLITDQNHEQHYGIEHMAVVTDDYTATLGKLRDNGVAVLEELTGRSGSRVAFVAAPDGAQMEIIEKA